LHEGNRKCSTSVKTTNKIIYQVHPHVSPVIHHDQNPNECLSSDDSEENHIKLPKKLNDESLISEWSHSYGSSHDAFLDMD